MLCFFVQCEFQILFDIKSLINKSMELILNDNSEKGAHVRSNLCYFICIWHLYISRIVTNQSFFFSKNTYFPLCVRNMFSATMLYKHHARKGALYFFIGYYVILDINKSRYFPFKFIKVQEPC